MTARRRSLAGAGACVIGLVAASALAGCGATFGPTQGQLETWAQAALESDPDVVAVAAYTNTVSEVMWYEIALHVTLREGADVTYDSIVNIYRALTDASAGHWRGDDVILRFESASEDYAPLDAGAAFDAAKPDGDPTGCVRSQWEDVVICLDSPQPAL